jgi:competence protein ComEC
VIDLGCSAGFSPLAWLKKQRSSIDLLVISHPHGDHIDEINLLSDFKVDQLLRPKWLTDKEVYDANVITDYGKVKTYLELNSSYNGIPGQFVGAPGASGGVVLESFSSPTCGRSNINNHSLVAAVTYAGFTILVGGDNEPPSWNCLLDNPRFVQVAAQAAVFVASHHGRLSGHCSDLFKVLKPQLCIISDGREQDTSATNRYSACASGYWVQSRTGGPPQLRKAITTRNDGYIDINVNFTLQSGTTASVSIK